MENKINNNTNPIIDITENQNPPINNSNSNNNQKESNSTTNNINHSENQNQNNIQQQQQQKENEELNTNTSQSNTSSTEIEKEKLAVQENRKLFMANISRQTTDNSFTTYFAQFGEIETSKLLSNRTLINENRCYGFVTYSKTQDATAVLENNTLTLDGRALKVQLARPKESRFKRRAEHVTNYFSPKLYIGGLSYQTDNKSLFNYFTRFGELEDYIVMRESKDDETSKSRGFGFIIFKKPEDSEKALAETDPELDGRRIDIKYAVPLSKMSLIERRKRSLHISGGGIAPYHKKVFIRGIDPEVTEHDMKMHFRRYGQVKEVTILRGRHLNPDKKVEEKEFRNGFVYFDTVDSAIHLLISEGAFRIFNGVPYSVEPAKPRHADFDGMQRIEPGYNDRRRNYSPVRMNRDDYYETYRYDDRRSRRDIYEDDYERRRDIYEDDYERRRGIYEDDYERREFRRRSRSPRRGGRDSYYTTTSYRPSFDARQMRGSRRF